MPLLFDKFAKSPVSAPAIFTHFPRLFCDPTSFHNRTSADVCIQIMTRNVLSSSFSYTFFFFGLNQLISIAHDASYTLRYYLRQLRP